MVYNKTELILVMRSVQHEAKKRKWLKIRVSLFWCIQANIETHVALNVQTIERYHKKNTNNINTRLGTVGKKQQQQYTHSRTHWWVRWKWNKSQICTKQNPDKWQSILVEEKKNHRHFNDIKQNREFTRLTIRMFNSYFAYE